MYIYSDVLFLVNSVASYFLISILYLPHSVLLMMWSCFHAPILSVLIYFLSIATLYCCHLQHQMLLHLERCLPIVLPAIVNSLTTTTLRNLFSIVLVVYKNWDASYTLITLERYTTWCKNSWEHWQYCCTFVFLEVPLCTFSKYDHSASVLTAGFTCPMPYAEPLWAAGFVQYVGQLRCTCCFGSAELLLQLVLSNPLFT